MLNFSEDKLLSIVKNEANLGIEMDVSIFDKMHRNAHWIADIRPAGKWPATYFYYAGGLPRVVKKIKESLHLNAMTATGKTLLIYEIAVIIKKTRKFYHPLVSQKKKLFALWPHHLVVMVPSQFYMEI